jgi:DNA modification methylase
MEQQEQQIKLGDFELDTIVCGDCLELMRGLPDKSVDLVLTDPPYEIHADSGGGLHNKRDWLRNVHCAGIDRFEPEAFLPEVERITKNFHAYIFTSKALLTRYIGWLDGKGCGWELIVYAKNNPIPTKSNKYLSDKEYCIFARKPGTCYFNNDNRYDAYFTVKHVNIHPSEWGHPTEKDLATIQDMVVMSCEPRGIILDPFIGSGTTAVAAIRTGRHFLGFEISPEYCAIANKRIKNELMQTKLEL